MPKRRGKDKRKRKSKRNNFLIGLGGVSTLGLLGLGAYKLRKSNKKVKSIPKSPISSDTYTPYPQTSSAIVLVPGKGRSSKYIGKPSGGKPKQIKDYEKKNKGFYRLRSYRRYDTSLYSKYETT